MQQRPFIVFRDPLFTNDRDRCLALCDEIRSRGLKIRFECETRLDRLDAPLIDAMHKAGLAVISFGVETLSVDTLRRAGRRPIPPEQQQRIMIECSRRGIATAAFYVFGFLQDDWSSIAATIDYAIELGSTVAQFKLLTPYPGTPMWKQLAPLIYEKDWQRFDGFTPTFTHPSLTAEELSFLLGAAYTRFYMGFSAGGHLASTAATHFDNGKADAADPIDRAGCGPDFLILGYPVISTDPAIAHAGSVRNLLGENPDPKLLEDMSNDLRVTAQTPPTFIFQTNADTTVVAENSVRFYLALRKAKVPAEMHIFENGPHGVGLSLEDPALSMWPTLLTNWMRGRGLLTKP